MAGTETAGFDLVMQFSEEAYHELLGVFFDESGIIGRIVDLIPGVDANEFTLDVALDRPTDVGLPAGVQNTLDILLGLGESGSVATLRMVVGIVVDRSAPDRDTVRIDFRNGIHFARVTLGGATAPIPNLESRLQNLIPSLPVLPVPVDRSTDDPKQIRRVDFAIVDDTTGADRDATSAMLTFGGGSPGDAGALRSIVPDGGRGAIGIFFRWLCRLAVPSLESSLGLPAGSFTITNDRCSLNTTVRIHGEEEVDLTSLTLSLDDGFIAIRATIAKSGFCYDASGEVGARLRLEIVDGRLVASAEIADPDVDVSMPWYCWLGAAAIGAALGGILAGVIGTIVGAVLVPLITWLVVEAVEGTIEEVAEKISDAINSAVPEVDVPAFGVEIVFQRVFIDDIVIQSNLRVQSNAPVRVEGTTVLAPGQGIDLDTGLVGGGAVAAADLIWEGDGWSARLRTGCQATLARTGSSRFDLPRFELYSLRYEPRVTVPIGELGIPNPFGFFSGDDVIESRRVYALRTNEGRYALVQAVEIQDGRVHLRYRTFETRQVSVRIKGDFACQRPLRAPKDALVAFEPSDVAAQGRALQRERVLRAAAPNPKIEACGRQVATPPLHEGRWVARFPAPQNARARLEAVGSGAGAGAQYLWRVGGKALADGSAGDFEVEGTKVRYEVAGAVLVLEVPGQRSVELFVEVTLVDDGGCSATAARCLRHTGKCPTKVRTVPTWPQFLELQALPAAALAAGAVVTAEGRLVPAAVRESVSCC